MKNRTAHVYPSTPRTMKRWIPCLLLASCGAPPQQFSAPAPETALACAAREADELGYSLLEGRVERGSLLVSQRIPPPPGRASGEPDPNLEPATPADPSEIAVENQLRISHTDGRLQLEVLALGESGTPVDAGGTVTEHARAILAECTTGASAMR